MANPALNVLNRKCGPCSVCCTVMSVEDLQKPRLTTCKHVCAAGCGIYAQRPAVCGEYECMWKFGDGLEEDRPDKLGLLFWNAMFKAIGGNILFCEEARAGALQTPRAKALLAERSRKQLVFVRGLSTGQVVQLIGPQRERERVAPLLQKYRVQEGMQKQA